MSETPTSARSPEELPETVPPESESEPKLESVTPEPTPEAVTKETTPEPNTPPVFHTELLLELNRVLGADLPTEKYEEPEPYRGEGDAEKFTDVLRTCVRSVGTSTRPSQYLPLCHSALGQVSAEDFHAFQATHAEASESLEATLASVMEDLHDKNRYRSVGLYVALLMQGIDLHAEGKGPLTQGKAGEVSQRLAAVVQQSVQARDSRRKLIPTWAKVTFGVLGTLLGIFIGLAVGLAVFALRRIS